MEVHAAIRKGDLQRVVALLGRNTELLHAWTPFGTWLHDAATCGQCAIAQWLIAQGVDVNACKVANERPPLADAAAEGHVDVVQLLIASGAMLDTSTSVRNPLFAAIVGGNSDAHTKVAKLLIDSGIDTAVRYPNLENVSALEFAQQYGRAEVATLLDPSCGNLKHSRPKTHSEKPFSDSMAESLRAEVERGLDLLGMAPDDEPANIVAAVDAFVYSWQCGDKPPKHVLDTDDAPFTLGAVWGQQLVREFQWEWRTVQFHEHGDIMVPGVLSPDRALAVYPIHFIMGCLQDSTVDTTILIAFNMLKAGTIGDTSPGSYFNLMDGVHRIIPRSASPKR